MHLQRALNSLQFADSLAIYFGSKGSRNNASTTGSQHTSTTRKGELTCSKTQEDIGTPTGSYSTDNGAETWAFKIGLLRKVSDFLRQNFIKNAQNHLFLIAEKNALYYWMAITNYEEIFDLYI